MQFLNLVLAVLPFVAVTLAADDRLLYSVPSFETSFTSVCATWPAAAGMTFVEALYEAGDYQGENADTEAKIVCSYRSTEGPIVTFTADVAESLGATPISD